MTTKYLVNFTHLKPNPHFITRYAVTALLLWHFTKLLQNENVKEFYYDLMLLTLADEKVENTYFFSYKNQVLKISIT